MRSTVSQNPAIFLLIFCLGDLSIFDSGILNFPTMTVSLSISLKVLQDFLYIFRCIYIGCIYVYKSYIFLQDCSLQYYVVTFFVTCYGLSFELCFVCCYKYCYPSIVYVYSHEFFFSIPSLSASVHVLFQGGSLVGNIYVGHVFLSTKLPYVFCLEHLIHLHLR